MKNIRILAAHHDTLDAKSYTTVLFEKILPILRSKKNVHLTWLIHKVEKIQPMDIDSNTTILDIHDFKNAVEVIRKVKPNLVYALPGREHIGYALMLAARFLNVPVIGGGLGRQFFTKKKHSSTSVNPISQFLQNLINTQNRIGFLSRLKFYIYKNMFLIRTQKTVKIDTTQIISLSYSFITNYFFKSVSEGWRGFDARFAADLNFLDGELMKKPLIDAGWKDSSLMVVGNPLYDDVFQQSESVESENKKRDATNVLFITVNMFGFNPKWIMPKRITMTKKIVSDISKEKNMSLKIKIHPTGETISEYESMIEHLDASVSIHQKEDLEQLVEWADVVISTSTSTALIYALLAKKPIIIHNCFELDYDELTQRGLVIECKELSDIVPTIKKAIGSELPTKKIDELVNDVLFKLDGKASERISDSIIRLLDNIEQKN